MKNGQQFGLKRVLRFLAKNTGTYGALQHLRVSLPRTKKMRVLNSTIKIPFIRGIACPISEPWMIDLLSELLPQQRGAFFDVGVNLGQTLVKLKAVDPERDYVGFEPNPVCAWYSQELIKANGFRNCELLPVGLFNEDNLLTLELMCDEVTDSAGSLITNFRPSHMIRSRMFVPVFRYEVIERAIGVQKVGIVKIDVENAELEVLRSLSDLILRERPIVVLEILPAENAFIQERQDATEEFLSNMKYELFRVKKTLSDNYAGLVRLSKIENHVDLTLCDYAAIPSERAAALRITRCNI